MEERRNIARKTIKWLLRTLYAVIFAVLYYFLFSLFFDTPIEHELKQSTRGLTNQYNKLEARLDTLERVYENVIERDKSVYKILFEAEPYTEHKGETTGGLTTAELEKMNNHELGEMFDKGISRLSQRVVTQSIRMDIQKGYISLSTDQVNRIPSIQPIDNKGLTLLTASYGNLIHPFYKSPHMHRGVDYSLPVGTAIFATADGVVERIESKGQSTGLSITIRHSDRYETVYSNLDKVLIAPGKSVVRGDIIAFSGNSGLSFAPHLHYEVHQNGVAVNPLPFFFAELDVKQKSKMKSIASVGMQSFD